MFMSVGHWEGNKVRMATLYMAIRDMAIYMKLYTVYYTLICKSTNGLQPSICTAALHQLSGRWSMWLNLVHVNKPLL
jgi:hypothetical protein